METIANGEVVDSIYLDFAKAFVSVPHRRLKYLRHREDRSCSCENIKARQSVAVITCKLNNFFSSQYTMTSNDAVSTESHLDLLGKNELIDIILSLKKEIISLNDDFKKITNLRFYHLERNQNMLMQYGRRDSVEISGMPQEIQKGSVAQW